VVNEVQLITLVTIGDRWLSIEYYYVQCSVFRYYHALFLWTRVVDELVSSFLSVYHVVYRVVYHIIHHTVHYMAK
jgi:hypothetical protein